MQTSKTHLVDVYVRGAIKLESILVHYDGPVSIRAIHKEFGHATAMEMVSSAIHKKFSGEAVIEEHLTAADFADEITCVHEVAKLRHPLFKNEFERFLRDANANGRAGHVWGKLLEVAAHRLSPEPSDSCTHCRTRIMLSATKQQRQPVWKMNLTTSYAR